jgi:hypothetical protein
MLLTERKTDYLIFFDFLLYSTIPYHLLNIMFSHFYAHT